MGKFNGKIAAEFNPPRKWVLTRALSYKNEEIDSAALGKVGVKVTSDRVSVPKGFVTDLASVPRGIWWLIAPWDIARAAVIHDLLYKRIRQYRAEEGDLDDNKNANMIVWNYKSAKKAADDVFLMGMKDAEPAVAKWKIYSAYNAVRLFGRWSIIPREED
jgi:hypothetical protein